MAERKTYLIEITLPNGTKLQAYPIDRDAFLIASETEVAARLAADIVQMIKQANEAA